MTKKKLIINFKTKPLIFDIKEERYPLKNISRLIKSNKKKNVFEKNC